MTRYSDFRQTTFKGVAGIDKPYLDNEATPRRLSAMRRGTLRIGIDPVDVYRPQESRRSRRKAKPRQRLGGVALSREEMPWMASE